MKKKIILGLAMTMVSLLGNAADISAFSMARLSIFTKGIYIHGGKKIVIKE